MEGLAPDDAAERHRPVVRAAGVGGGVERDRHAGRNFERARHLQDVMGRAGRRERARRAGEQVRADVFVIARLDDEEASALDTGRGGCGAAMLGHWLSGKLS